MIRSLARALLPGALALFLSASAWGAEEATGLRFRAGMAALAAAHVAPDRETRDAFLDEAIAAFRAILIRPPGPRRASASSSLARSSSRARTGWRGGISSASWPASPPPPWRSTSTASSIRDARPQALVRPRRRGAGARQQHLLAVGRAHHPHRHPVRAAAVYGSGRQAAIRRRRRGLGRRGIPAPAGPEAPAALAAQGWRRRLAEGVPIERIRPDLRRRPSRPAPADRQGVGGERPGQRPPELARRRGGLPRPRGAHRGPPPAQPANRGLRQRRTARAPLRGARLARRAAHRPLGWRLLGGEPDDAGERRPRLEPAADRAGAPAQRLALGPAGGDVPAALGLHRRADRARCATRTTRATGRPSSSAAGSARTSPARSGSTSTTGPSPWAGSARSSRR